jgi:hypothetical protein
MRLRTVLRCLLFFFALMGCPPAPGPGPSAGGSSGAGGEATGGGAATPDAGTTAGGTPTGGGTTAVGFAIVPDVAAIAVPKGGSQRAVIRVETSPQFSGAILLQAGALPTGVQAVFDPPSVNPPEIVSSALTLTASIDATVSPLVDLRIQGTAGQETAQALLAVSVFDQSQPTFGMSASPRSAVLMPGKTIEVFVDLVGTATSTGPVTLTAEALPVGVTATFSPATVTLGSVPVSASLSLTASGQAPPSDRTLIRINGSSATGTASTALQLRVAPSTDLSAGRWLAIAAVERTYHALTDQGLSGDALLNGVLADMRTRPEYSEVAAAAKNLMAWGRFADGSVHVISANRDVEPSAAAPPTLPKPFPLQNVALPQGTRARLFHSFGKNFDGQDAVDRMAGFFRNRGWVLRPGTEGDTHVGLLKGLKNESFVYINAHGGFTEEGMYKLQTSTEIDEDYDKVFKPDLLDQKLVYLTGVNGLKRINILQQVKDRTSTWYAITYKFVDAYMGFSSGSVVWLNACESNDSEFVKALQRKGATLVLAWSGSLTPAAAFRSAPYFVDRMLGANQDMPKESPPQRPFPYDLVLADMAAKGLDADGTNKLVATLKPSATAKPIFAPSIRRLEVNEAMDQLVVHGEFGVEQGAVSVDGTMTTCVWGPDRIVCPLPRSGSGSSGDVVVQVNRVKSNARQLTEWQIPVDYEWVGVAGSPAAARLDGTGTMRFRADVAGFRTKPAEALQFEERGGPVTQDSQMIVTGSGQWSSGASCTSTLSGVATYVAAPQSGPGHVLLGFVKMRADTSTAAVGFGLSGPVSHRITRSGSASGCSGTIPTPVVTGFLEGQLSFPRDQSQMPQQAPSVPAINLVLDSAFGLPAKAVPSTLYSGMRVTLRAGTAKSPPRDTDDSGK